MPDGNEEDIPLELDEGLGEDAPTERPVEGSPVPEDLHYIVNTYADLDMEDAYPPMMSPDEILKADWFLSFKSDQNTPDELDYWLESRLPDSGSGNSSSNGMDSRMGAREAMDQASQGRTYYSGVVYNNEFMYEAAGRTFFHHLWLDINGPWMGENSRTFTPTRMTELAEDLDSLFAMLNDAQDSVGNWRTSAEEALKGATADVFVQHLVNLQLRFYDLAAQVGSYPEPLRDLRNAVVITAGNNIRGLYDEWLATGLWDPYHVIRNWFDENSDIATLNRGDDTSQIGDIGKANDPNTWKEIQERIKKHWRNQLNDLIEGAAGSMRTLAGTYTDTGGEFVEVERDTSLTLDWSPVGGGGGLGPGPNGGDEDGDGKSDAQKEYEDTLDDWYEKQTQWLKDNPPGGGEGDGEGDGSDGPSKEDEYNEALDDWYQRQIDDLESGPESSEGDLGGGDSGGEGPASEDEYNQALDDYYQDATEDLRSGPDGGGGDLGDGGGDGSGSDGPASEDEYNQALDDYYQDATEDLRSGPDGGGGDLGDGGGDGSGSDGPASEERFNQTLDDYYNQQADELEQEMGGPPPVGGGGQLGGGGSGGGSGNRNRPSEERFNQSLDDYYNQQADELDEQLNGGPDSGGGDLGGDGSGSQPSAEEYEQRLDEYYKEQTGGLDRLMRESPDPDGDGRTDDGEALTPAQQEYQSLLDDYYQEQSADLERLVSGPEGGGGDLGGDGGEDSRSSAEEYEQRLQEYYDDESADLDRLRSDVDDITDENGNPPPELEEYREQLSDYYDRRSQELDDLVAGPESGGGGLGGDGGGGSDAADEYQRRLDEYYDQQRADLEERMNAGPEAGGGGLGDSLGRDYGGGQGDGEPSYSIGDGWNSPGAQDQALAPSASGGRPDANGIQSGGGDLRSDPGSGGGGDAFTGAVGGNGQGSGNFGGLGAGMGAGGMPPMMPPMGGGMGGMGGGGGQGESRTRSTWLSEDERVWGTSEGDRLSVLGRPGPGDMTKGNPDEYVPGAGGAGARTSTGAAGEGHPGKRKPGIGNRRGRLQGPGDQREDQR
ncbi:hypothetical protein [Nocardiopsis aegyptia]|uniref:Uncharacterized protein n=1 Tax=Nocardiopsis aegyptia TaxID=220378 RepID=A0A7Z0EV69_9ACTN|nr:hypothetical protein [Nocardiopsis aegyptia]NYJ37903.1 hypothetical protein [Nocardiopsis aegyptia]